MTHQDKNTLTGIAIFVAGVGLSAFVGVGLLKSGIQDGLTFVLGGYTDAWALTWAIVKTSICVPFSAFIFGVFSVLSGAVIRRD